MATTACPVALFDQYVAASTLKGTLNAFNQICQALQLDPLDHAVFYDSVKQRMAGWKSGQLWTVLDERRALSDYCGGRACASTNVLIIGGGPCGLRCAIECALLGARTVLVERRAHFSRNNVLHLWPFVMNDLKELGAKLFYPKFGVGAIDHISIRQLQLILLKIALLLGVEVHENVAFEELILPHTDEQTGTTTGWRADFTPSEHILSEYHFDAILAADGKSYSLPGFTRTEMRGKLAIGITANFVNRKTHDEERVQEIRVWDWHLSLIWKDVLKIFGNAQRRGFHIQAAIFQGHARGYWH